MQLRFKDFGLDHSVKTGIHIVSIDDTRQFYSPMLWDRASHQKQKMEQIWMPGVHADIGGGYRKEFISTVSLLTMVDRLAENCPDVGFDTNYISKFPLKSLLDQNVAINNEWKEHFSFLHLGRGRHCDGKATDFRQFAHPLLAALRGQNIEYKSKTMKYSPSYVASAFDVALPEAGFGCGSYWANYVAPALKTKFS